MCFRHASITISSSQAAAAAAGRVLKTLSYFDKRPAMTYKYGVFDQRTWTAHIGMGNETQGSAIAGGLLSEG